MPPLTDLGFIQPRRAPDPIAVLLHAMGSAAAVIAVVMAIACICLGSH